MTTNVPSVLPIIDEDNPTDCIFTIKKPGHEETKINGSLYYYRGSVYFLSNEEYFNGARPERRGDVLPLDYKYSWSLNSGIDFSLGINLNNLMISDELTTKHLVKIEVEYKGVHYETQEPQKLSIIGNNYELRKNYYGIESYHHSHIVSNFYNNPLEDKESYKIGCELEVISNDTFSYNILSRMNSNIIFCEKDPSLTSRGLELITVPLLPKDAMSIKFWMPILKEVSKYSHSWDNSNCGLHIHIGRTIFKDGGKNDGEMIKKLAYFYYSEIQGKTINKLINGRSIGYNAAGLPTSTPELSAVKEFKIKLNNKDIRNKVGNSLIKMLTSHSSTSRFNDINITNSNTIEFRLGKGSINVNRIVCLVTYYVMMCNYVQYTSWSSLSLDGFEKFIIRNTSNRNPLSYTLCCGEPEITYGR